jgi:hypothetical protein
MFVLTSPTAEMLPSAPPSPTLSIKTEEYVSLDLPSEVDRATSAPTTADDPDTCHDMSRSMSPFAELIPDTVFYLQDDHVKFAVRTPPTSIATVLNAKTKQCAGGSDGFPCERPLV